MPRLVSAVICKRCGRKNVEASTFCSACGARLHRDSLERRKLATLVFCDLVGSTALGERLDAEVVRDFMSTYFSRMRDAIERHGGTVEKFIGDAVVGVFGVPKAHEDDALRALRATCDMQAQVAELGADAERAFGVRVAVRIGVNTGRVVASVGGDQALVTGDAVNTAARLEQAASPGMTLIGATTWRLTRDAIRAEPERPVVAKGKAEPLEAFRLVALLPDRDGDRPAAPRTLIGRTEEQGVLRDALAGCVHDRRSNIVVVIGDAGVGKSRLVSEFLSSVSAGATIIGGRCLSYGDGVTYWALGEAIRAAASIQDEDEPEEVLTKLRRIVPEEPAAASHVARAMGVLEGTSSPAEIAWGARKLFENVASDRPLVVLVDDLHWAESPLVELLLNVGQMAGAPILILAVGRPEAIERWSDLPNTIHLQPLSSSFAKDLLRQLMGELPPQDVVDRLLARAQGNPLFIEELAGMLVETRSVVRSGAAWIVDRDATSVPIPPTIDALLDSRLDALPEEERRPLECGSIEGQVFHQGAVEEVLGRVNGDIGAPLMRLTERNILRAATPEFGAGRAFEFRHLLIRDAAYRGIPKKARAEWHARFADWLLAMVDRRVAEFEEIIGYHLEQAHRLRSVLGLFDDETRSVGRQGADHLASAAGRARDRGDIDGALLLLSRADAMLEPGDAARPPIMVELGILRREGRDLAGAMETLRQAVELADRLGDASVAAHARAEQAFLRLDVEAGAESSEAEDDMARAADVLRESGDEARLLQVMIKQATAASFRGMIGAGEHVLTEASKIAIRIGDRSIASRIAWERASFADMGPAPTSEGLRRVGEALEDAIDRPRMTAELLLLRAIFLAMRGEFEEATETTNKGEATLVELGEDEFTIPMTAEARYRIAHLMGDLDAEERAIRGCYVVLKERGNLGHLVSLGWRLGDVLCRRGDWVDARPFIDESRRLAAADDIDVQVGWRIAMGRALAAEGNAESEEVLLEAVAVGRRSDYINHTADALMTLAETRHAMGLENALSPARGAWELYTQKESLVMAERASILLHSLGG